MNIYVWFPAQALKDSGAQLNHVQHPEIPNSGLNELYALVRGNFTGFSHPIRFDLMRRKREPEIILTTVGGPVLIKPSIVDLFNKNSIKGFELFEVLLDGKMDYSGMAITGRITPIAIPNRSNIVKTSYGKGLPEFDAYRGFILDYASWDGSDIFMAENYNYFFVTDRFRLLMKAHFKRHTFINILEYDMPVRWDDYEK